MELRIKEVCKLKGISQQELAKRLDITYQALHSRINGNPSIERLQEIADALDCEVHELLSTSFHYAHFYDKNEWLGIRKK